MSSPKSTVRRIAAHHYIFQSRWNFDCDVEAVYEVLSRLEEYSSWWPQITLSESDPKEGLALIHLRSALPFTLKFSLQRQEENRSEGRLRASVAGDIDGFVAWTVGSSNGATNVRFDQEVTLEQAVVRRFDIGVRPVLQWNHAVAMRGCARGLRHRLSST